VRFRCSRVETFFVILDHPVGCHDGRKRSGFSLLQIPLGAETLAGHITRILAAAGSERVVVVSPFDHDAAYETSLREEARVDIKTIARDQAVSWLQQLEPGDDVLLADARCWTIPEIDLLEFRAQSDWYPGATYCTALGSDPEAANERVQTDVDGHIRYIRRFYDRVTQPAAHDPPIPYAFVPAWALHDVDVSLSVLRRQLLENGVFCRDLPTPVDVFDMAVEEDVLMVQERILSRRNPVTPAGFSLLSPGVLLGRGALVHSSVKVVPPVVIHDGVLVESNATVIGPASIGAGSTVGRDSLIARSLISGATTVPAGESVRDRVLIGGSRLGPGIVRTRVDDRGALRGAIQLQDSSRRPEIQWGLKRVLDILVAMIGLMILSPLLAVVAVLIKATSRGPVLFAHIREGRGGRQFKCYKFRTMRVGAHALQRELYRSNMVDGPQFKLRDDPRVTAIGQRLRETNIDELPQLINVLLGDMSLVGPRPSPFRENQICVPWRRARLSVRPGITGLWQICRHSRCQGDFQQWIFFDLLYVRHWSLWLDLKILLATVLTLGGRWTVPLSWILRVSSPGHAKALVEKGDAPGVPA